MTSNEPSRPWHPGSKPGIGPERVESRPDSPARDLRFCAPSGTRTPNPLKNRRVFVAASRDFRNIGFDLGKRGSAGFALTVDLGHVGADGRGVKRGLMDVPEMKSAFVDPTAIGSPSHAAFGINPGSPHAPSRVDSELSYELLLKPSEVVTGRRSLVPDEAVPLAAALVPGVEPPVEQGAVDEDLHRGVLEAITAHTFEC